MADQETNPVRGGVGGPERRRSVTRGVRLAALLAVLALAVVVVAGTLVLTGPPSRQQLLERAGLIGKRELLVGVKDDQPGIALRDPKTGAFSGFDIDIALMVAADLGFRPGEVRFLAIESEDRPKMQAKTDDGRFVTVDLVVASYSITSQREALDGVTFSAAYLRTEQSVVTREDYPGSIDTLQDLRGKLVCTLSTATSESEAGRAGVRLIAKKRISECVDALNNGDKSGVVAVTTDAAILAGFVAKYPDLLRHHDIGLDAWESYGINTGDNEALRDLVNLSLYESRTDPADRSWEDAYDRHLRPEQPASESQQVAVDQQPGVDRVEVRRWPWETTALPPVTSGRPGAVLGRRRRARRSSGC